MFELLHQNAAIWSTSNDKLVHVLEREVKQVATKQSQSNRKLEEPNF